MAEEVKEAKWYAVHTYSGYENKVKANIEKSVDNRGMQDQILEVAVPMEDCIEERNGRQVVVQRKIFPGYVLVKMAMNENTWYVVRNIRGVTGFVGPGSDPVPLSDEEIDRLGIHGTVRKIRFEVGESVNVIDGPITGVGRITSIDEATETVIVSLTLFGGQETPVELNFRQIAKIS
ncbi:MAG: transcription termination/antitermination factor NusG [Firmicutes bacterium]|nr:transcription termination/antitermination factor NusG [Bacillota bacterium]